LIEIWMAFPGLILAMLLLVLMGSGLAPVIIAISAARIPGVARVLRSVALVSREYTYVEAARVIGASEARILLRHVLPNAIAPFLILASAGLGSAILTEASLGFLGLGIPPTSAPTWGNMLSGRVTATINPRWWLVVFPGIALTVTVLAFNLFGDALRDLFDPKLRGSEGARGAR
jgi:ABC-type dipeptide/oligopeptide/nickel transport system permease subunit